MYLVLQYKGYGFLMNPGRGLAYDFFRFVSGPLIQLDRAKPNSRVLFAIY